MLVSKASHNIWDDNLNLISMFDMIKKLAENIKNIIISLNHMISFIDKRDIENNRKSNLSYLKGFGQVAWSLISTIYKSGWDKLKTSNGNWMFRQNILSQFNEKNMNNNKSSNNKLNNKRKNIPVKFSNLPAPASIDSLPLVPLRLSREKLNKYKFYKKKKDKNTSQWSYVQAFSANIKEILKIKKYFSQLSDKKVEEVHKTIINSSKPELHINMTIKELLQKQIIVSNFKINWPRLETKQGELCSKLFKCLNCKENH